MSEIMIHKGHGVLKKIFDNSFGGQLYVSCRSLTILLSLVWSQFLDNVLLLRLTNDAIYTVA